MATCKDKIQLSYEGRMHKQDTALLRRPFLPDSAEEFLLGELSLIE